MRDSHLRQVGAEENLRAVLVLRCHALAEWSRGKAAATLGQARRQIASACRHQPLPRQSQDGQE